MQDLLWIEAYWNEEKQRNEFGVRGRGERYDSLYRWLNGGSLSVNFVSNDFPWDYVAFNDLYDEQQFMTAYETSIRVAPDSPYRLQPKAQYKKGITPIEDRIVGESYLNNCGHYHVHDSRTWDEQEAEIIARLSSEVAKEIDAEILAELLALSDKDDTI